MYKTNKIAIVFCVSILQQIHGSTQIAASDTNKSLLNSISWVYITVPTLTFFSSFLGYTWWKNHRAVKQDEEILKSADNLQRIKGTLVSTFTAKKKDMESVRELQKINAHFNLYTEEAQEDAEIEKLYNDNYDAYIKSDSDQHSKPTTDYRTEFSNGFDALPLHKNITRRRQDLNDQRIARNMSATGTILGFGGVVTLSVLKALGKI